MAIARPTETTPEQYAPSMERQLSDEVLWGRGASFLTTSVLSLGESLARDTNEPTVFTPPERKELDWIEAVIDDASDPSIKWQTRYYLDDAATKEGGLRKKGDLVVTRGKWEDTFATTVAAAAGRAGWRAVTKTGEATTWVNCDQQEIAKEEATVSQWVSLETEVFSQKASLETEPQKRALLCNAAIAIDRTISEIGQISEEAVDRISWGKGNQPPEQPVKGRRVLSKRPVARGLPQPVPVPI